MYFTLALGRQIFTIEGGSLKIDGNWTYQAFLDLPALDREIHLELRQDFIGFGMETSERDRFIYLGWLMVDIGKTTTAK